MPENGGDLQCKMSVWLLGPTLHCGLTLHQECFPINHQFFGGSHGLAVREGLGFQSVREALIKQIDACEPYINAFIEQGMANLKKEENNV